MANLIPSDAKRRVVKEYWVRVATVWLFLLAILAVSLAILCVPLYVLISTEIGARAEVNDAAALDNAAIATAEASIKEANETAKILSASATSSASFSEYMRTLDTLAETHKVVLNTVMIGATKQRSELNVSGVATTRESLATFVSSVETHTLFATATLPIANLAKDKDIAFSLTISPRTKK